MGAVLTLLTGNAIGGAFGALQKGAAEANAAKYNAEVAATNAKIATQQANIAGQSGAQQEANIGMKARALAGELTAEHAARGVDVNSGSAADINASTAELGMLDSLTARSQATREAYSYYTQAKSDTAQGVLDQYAAKNDIQAGQIDAASTFMGAAGQGATQFQQWQLDGGGGGIGVG
jgi:hypothetical protein